MERSKITRRVARILGLIWLLGIWIACLDIIAVFAATLEQLDIDTRLIHIFPTVVLPLIAILCWILLAKLRYPIRGFLLGMILWIGGTGLLIQHYENKLDRLSVSRFMTAEERKKISSTINFKFQEQSSSSRGQQVIFQRDLDHRNELIRELTNIGIYKQV